MAQWFWGRRFFNFVNVFSLFRNYLPLEKGTALYLNKLDSPSPEDAVSQGCLKLSQWIWRGKFLKFVNVILPFRHYLPLETLKSPSSRDSLSQVWLKLVQWFWRRRWKCGKFTTTMTMLVNDNNSKNKGQIVISKAHLSLQLWWAKMLLTNQNPEFNLRVEFS